MGHSPCGDAVYGVSHLIPVLIESSFCLIGARKDGDRKEVIIYAKRFQRTDASSGKVQRGERGREKELLKPGLCASWKSNHLSSIVRGCNIEEF
eukprot:76518-Rhodomonas_salina.1